MTSDCIERICTQANGTVVKEVMDTLGAKKGVLFNATKKESPEVQLATDQIVHLLEGWLNYSVAISCLLNNANSQAVHLAYYAELRAALSLYAWSGISTRLENYFFIDSLGKVRKVSSREVGGTHKFAWELWSVWTKQEYAKRLLMEKISLYPKLTLGEIGKQIPKLNVSPAILENWGYDLVLDPTNDRKYRNRASYGTVNLASSNLLTKKSVSCEFFFDIWNQILSFNGFTLNFDAFLLKYLIGQVGLKEEKFLNRLNNFFPEANVIANVVRSDIKSQIFECAALKKDSLEGILSRALVMLRYATLATNDSIKHTKKLKVWFRDWLEIHEYTQLYKGETPIEVCELAYNDLLDQCSETGEPVNSLLGRETLSDVIKLTRPSICLSWVLSL